VQGILAYLASVVWLAFLLASVAAPVFGPPVVYFPTQYWPLPVTPPDQTTLALALVIGIFGLLILPKLLIGADAVLRGRARGFGGLVVCDAGDDVRIAVVVDHGTDFHAVPDAVGVSGAAGARRRLACA